MIYDDGVLLDIVWDGSIRGQNRGHLCVQADATREAPPLPEDQPVQDFASAKRDLLALIGQREVWATLDLKAATGFSEARFWKLVSTLRRSGLTESPARGFVRVASRQVAA